MAQTRLEAATSRVAKADRAAWAEFLAAFAEDIGVYHTRTVMADGGFDEVRFLQGCTRMGLRYAEIFTTASKD